MRPWLAAMGLAALASSAVADIAPDPQPSRERALHHYINARFAYSVDYPAGFLQAQPEADNGDGRAFTGGGAEARVWGSNYVQSPATIAAQIQADCGSARPAYRLVRADLVAMSCIAGGQVIYQKTLIVRGRTISLRVAYPASQRRIWDRMVTAMALSLRAR